MIVSLKPLRRALDEILDGFLMNSYINVIFRSLQKAHKRKQLKKCKK